ncbi:Gfo/Idh/MocA family protein [Rhizomonospora bruguierae]|uniref:Gfo/Idh/MocA family protein n=1 Tax=Rhizomonospora bruguierae TaxID=1581705 RepID=UPI001BD0EA79|nr:Gfo/Idh/MocA family oxidoreductase [Micromonospora sp. NBRC 107566]
MLNVAVIGLGWWGRKMVADLRASDSVRVVLGVDPTPAGRAAAAALGVPVSSDLGAALRDASVEAVVLCSPHAVHAAQIIASAAAGRHVFCEKPLATTRAEASRAVTACQEAGVVLGVGHERRFEPPVMRLRDLCAARAIGQPLVFEGNFSQNKFLALPRDNWRLSAEAAPVGPLSATGIHLVDLAVAVLGRPCQVLATLSNRATGFANGDTLTIHLGFDGGRTALITACLTTPFLGRVCVIGSRGWAEIRDREHPEDPQGWDMTVALDGSAPATTKHPPHPAVRSNVEAFAAAVRGTAPYPVAAHEMLATAAAFEAITRSVRSHRVEPINY